MKNAFTHFLTRYHPRSIRSLVYMLQASEYRAADYLRWFWRTRDFLGVEQRKTLVKTPKALVLLAVAYISVILLDAFAIWVLLVGVVWWRYLLFLAVVVVTPFVLAYGLAAILVITHLLQWPVEFFIVDYAKRQLRAHKALKIGIAGSFGKTSMREILKTVLSAGKKVAAPPGSYNTPLGISSFVRKLKGDEDILIFELGEYYPGDVKRLCNFVQPDIGVITGVNEAHLEKFKDLERTRKTIFELADYLKGRPLYINGESPEALGVSDSDRRGVVYYSRAGVADLKVTQHHTDLGGTSFALKVDKVALSAHSNLLGLHQIGPLSAAAHIALQLGLSPNQVEQGIAATKPFEHRLEPKTDAQGVTFLDDSYNGNPDGVRAVIDFLASLKGRRWYVTPGLVEMGERKEEVHKEIGRQLARAGIEKVVFIRDSVTPFIEEGLHEAGYKGEVLWFDRALDGLAALPNLTVKGDIVLLQNDWPDQYA